MVNQKQAIGLAIICVVAAVIVLSVILAILLFVRSKRKQNKEYVRLAIEESLNHKVVIGPSIEDRREDALMNARFFLRTSHYELITPLWNMGSCDKKYHFQLKSRKDKGSYLLTLQVKGDNCKLPMKGLSVRNNVKGLLKELKHPYILQTLEADFLKGQKVVLLTVRPFSEKRGSLRDIINRTPPTRTFAEKYNTENSGKALPMKYIKQFGRQILEALDFLQIHGYPYPHLHCGNVIVDGGLCHLTDYEKILLGQKAHYEEFTRNQTPLKDFACVLFEMTCGYEPSRKDIKHVPEGCNPEVAEIIHSIYFAEPPATLDDIIAHPFFDVKPRDLTETSGDETDITPAYLEVLQIASGKKEIKLGNKKKKKPPAPESKSSNISLEKKPIESAQEQPILSPPPKLPPPSIGSPVGSLPKNQSSDRSSLLADIRKDRKSGLKKVEVNDRSAPKI